MSFDFDAKYNGQVEDNPRPYTAIHSMTIQETKNIPTFGAKGLSGLITSCKMVSRFARGEYHPGDDRNQLYPSTSGGSWPLDGRRAVGHHRN